MFIAIVIVVNPLFKITEYLCLQSMAGPGTRGQAVRRQLQKNTSLQETVEGTGLQQAASGSNSINATTYVTPTSSSRALVNASNLVQTSESCASAANDTIPSSDDCQDDVTMPRRRGRTRNRVLATKREAKETLNIAVDPYIRRIVGQDSQYFISESGCVVRKFGRLNVDKWAHLDSQDRENIYKTVMDDFQFEENRTSKAVVNRQLQVLYRNHRYRLHKYFLTFRTKEEAIAQVPKGVSIDDWKRMCDYFTSEEFKKISARNKVNRAKNESHTTVGTKSLARLVEQKKRKEGVELSEIDLFEISRTSKKTGSFISDAAKETLASMKEMQDSTLMSSKEICEQQLGYIPGQLRVRSAAKKQEAEFERLKSELEENRRRADEAEQRATKIVEEFNAQFNAQKEVIKNLQEQQQETRELYEELIAQVKELRN